MSEKTKEYFISTALTFTAGFLLVVVPAIDTLTIEQLGDGTLVGILFSAVRLGLKMALQLTAMFVQAILAKKSE